MRLFLALLAFTFSQCTITTEDQIKREVIYKTDTIYISDKDLGNIAPWELDCGGGNQLEMNICSRSKLLVVDSVLKVRNSELLFDLDQVIENLEKQQSLSEMDIIELLNYRKQKNSLMEIHKCFKIMRAEVREFARSYYDGGTMMPMMVNLYAVQMTINQIEILRILKDGPKG
ncbi:MAG: hypothetical protein GQ574_18410 [Crocinitomix sp.]|nr:hypothetical protein [Crocinitomix sp.]